MLEETAERLRRAQKAGRLGTWDWDIRTNELIWDGVAAVHGIEEEAFDGTFDGYVRDMHPEDRPRVLAAIQSAAKTGSDLDIQYRIVLPDGSITWVAGRGTAFHDETGAIVRMAGTCQDITERMRVNEDKEALISYAAHELRSPLTSILGFSRILERLIGANPEAYDEVFSEAVQTISAESNRMKEIIDLFLDMARAESGQLHFEKSEFDIAELLRRAIELAEVKAPSAKIEASVPEKLVISSDSRRLEQVFANLLDNSLKYGDQPPRIQIACNVGSDYVAVRIANDGPPISDEDRPRLFERFYRGSSKNGSASGTGIGLYLARQFVTQLDGSLELTCPPGEKTEFTVTLPL